jgi:cholesterol transport system auxiliary component
MMIKILSLLFLLFVMSGCAGSSSYYILSNASVPVQTTHLKTGTIGVEKIHLPEYLFKREIAVARSSHEIHFLPGVDWGEDMDEGLTRRLIAYLQKRFAKPDVFAYPWGMDRQPAIKIRVDITRFIALDGKVHLDANWYIEDMKKGKKRAKLFSVSVPAGSDPESIVAAMDQAFTQLEASVAAGIE